MLASVAKTGGHLSSNLGTVELTVALHYVFDTPRDRLVFDVGHQTYAHKILTGRREAMSRLRMAGGPSGFPRRTESEYDTFGTAHSSTSISAALGMAVAAQAEGRRAGGIVAVIGDGAMTAGMAFEALNNAGAVGRPARNPERQRHVDFGSPWVRSTIISRASCRAGCYDACGAAARRCCPCCRRCGKFAKRFESHTKGMVLPGTMFEELGFNYIGPIDGHDLDIARGDARKRPRRSKARNSCM